MRYRPMPALLLCAALLAAIGLSPQPGLGATTQALPYAAGFPRSDANGPLWASSPTVVDINGDGKLDIMVGDNNGCVWAWSGAGQVLPGFPWKTLADCTTPARIRNPLAVANIDGQGGLEVAGATRGLSNSPGQRGRVYVWDSQGNLRSGWPQETTWTTGGTSTFSEAASAVLANMSGDADLEVLSGSSNSAGGPNLYAWSAGGAILSGFPTTYKTAGIFGPIGAADLNGDGYAEAVAGRDHPYAHAYTSSGSQIAGWPVATYYDPTKTDWGSVKSVEFTHNAPTMGDLDGDGTVEVVLAGRMRDNAISADPPYWAGNVVMVFEPSGARRSGWYMPAPSGRPLADIYMPTQAPALADLDRDGKLEIVVVLSDGTARAYRESGALMWSYNYARGKILFGSEPAIGDVTGDGQLDVVFGTYSPTGSANGSVGVIALNGRTGALISGYPLPLPLEKYVDAWGVMAAPTIANINGDCNAELVVASMSGVVYAWRLPTGFIPDRVPWPTGRQNNQRTGSFLAAPAPAPSASAAPAAPGDHNVWLPSVARC